MSENWPLLIGTLVEIKQALAGCDGGLWPHHYPEPKANEKLVFETEQRLGRPLPASYRDFLLHANGWRGFFQTVDLLSSQDLPSGPHRDYFDRTYGDLRADDLTACGLVKGEMLAFGLTLQDRDAFVFDLSRTKADEYRIVWIAGEPVDEWWSFPDFFRSMIEYNRREVRALAQS